MSDDAKAINGVLDLFAEDTGHGLHRVHCDCGPCEVINAYRAAGSPRVPDVLAAMEALRIRCDGECCDDCRFSGAPCEDIFRAHLATETP